MCADGTTSWAGQSCVEMPRADSCGEPCPPHMKYATHSSSGNVPMATCRGACLTCESELFKTARLSLGWKPDNSILKKCVGNEYILRTDDYDLPNYLSGYNSMVCKNDPTSWTAKYVCVSGDMHYRLYPGCEQENDEEDQKYFGCKIIDGEEGADDGDGEGFFERDEVDVDFKISGLKYQEIMDDTRDALEKVIEDLMAAGIDVDPSFIDIYLSDGSVKVKATVKASEAGVDASAVTSKVSNVTPNEIVAAVKTVPRIAEAAEGGSLDSISATTPAATVRTVRVPHSVDASTGAADTDDGDEAASSVNSAAANVLVLMIALSFFLLQTPQ
eukprot:gnl/TRDRNA2_/TRDRNA2_157636_c2_seq1.p1 gnl/TRDRNA2_/TRDRNA2_157636_c2~~gnl/TRDRNA2_/TRDRNA2_157636_c2_seq1.p1  ORF type:complete len:356 (+),score=70.26 gnl/TRDRNA2_/TRDRNA2_157636_c2_seq1:80-1069(+)